MKYNFDNFVERGETNCGKWEFMQMVNPNANQDTLPYWVADMDFPCPQPVLDAIHKRTDRQIFGYSFNKTDKFYRAICGWFQHRFGWYVNSNDVFYSPGVVPALSNLVKLLTEKGDGVLIQRPVYYPFTNSIVNNERVVVNNSLINNNGYYEIDFEDFENKAKEPNTKLFILCSPHNPVGRVFKEWELRKMAEICFENDVMIISDEIHYDLIRTNQTHTPLAKLLPEHKNKIVTCTAPSKTFNMAGMQYSSIIIHDEELKNKWNDLVGMSMPNALAIPAVEAAFEEGEEWLEQVKEYLDGNFKLIDEFLKEHLPLAKYRIPEGTYLAWIDLNAYEADNDKLTKIIEEDANIAVDMGSMFGDEGKGFIRINVSCTREILLQGLIRVAYAMNKIKAGEQLREFKYNTPWKTGVEISETIKSKKNTFLLFLRYYGCTVCQLDMIKIAEKYQEFLDKDSQVLVVLQSEAEEVRNNISEDVYPFDIICDPTQVLYKKYSIRPAYSMVEMMSLKALGKIKECHVRGLKHGKYEGNEQQLPALFIVNDEGKVTYAHYAKNLADLPNASEMLELIPNASEALESI